MREHDTPYCPSEIYSGIEEEHWVEERVEVRERLVTVVEDQLVLQVARNGDTVAVSKIFVVTKFVCDVVEPPSPDVEDEIPF
jgi:hypothetical protein